MQDDWIFCFSRIYSASDTRHGDLNYGYKEEGYSKEEGC